MLPMRCVAFLFAALVLSPAKAADPVEAIDPQSAEIVMRAAEFLVAQQRFSFNWFVAVDRVFDDNEKITFVRSGNTVMSRDGGFVAHSERDGKLRDFYYDGSNFTVASPSEEFYSTIPFTGGFDALVEAVREYTGTILPLWSLMSPNLADGLLDDVESGTYLGVTLVAGREAHHLAFREAEVDWQVWISTDDDTPLPIMIVGTEKTEAGLPQYRVFMNDWDLAPAIDPQQFRFSPGEEYIRVSLPVQIKPADGDGAAPAQDTGSE